MSHATADRYAWAEPGVEDLGGGVHRIPLPLPIEGLRAVNVYAIADPGGVDLIDAGIALVPAREQLAAGLRQIGYELGDVRNFFVTHIHIDHYSLAVELRKTFHNVISLGEEERANLIATREMVNGRGNRFFGMDGLRRLGAAELVTQFSRQSRQPPAIVDWEDPDRWLADGTDLDLRTRTLRAVHTPGHTRGHLVYHDAAARVLFAGDHVLPHITPSIGFEAAGNRMALAITSARWPGRSPCPTPGCCPPTARSPAASTSGSTSCWPTTTRAWPIPTGAVLAGHATPYRGSEGDQVDQAAPALRRPGLVQPGHVGQRDSRAPGGARGPRPGDPLGLGRGNRPVPGRVGRLGAHPLRAGVDVHRAAPQEPD